jgi:hypothetical protein
MVEAVGKAVGESVCTHAEKPECVFRFWLGYRQTMAKDDALPCHAHKQMEPGKKRRGS